MYESIFHTISVLLFGALGIAQCAALVASWRTQAVDRRVLDGVLFAIFAAQASCAFASLSQASAAELFGFIGCFMGCCSVCISLARYSPSLPVEPAHNDA